MLNKAIDFFSHLLLLHIILLPQPARHSCRTGCIRRGFRESALMQLHTVLVCELWSIAKLDVF